MILHQWCYQSGRQQFPELLFMLSNFWYFQKNIFWLAWSRNTISSWQVLQALLSIFLINHNLRIRHHLFDLPFVYLWKHRFPNVLFVVKIARVTSNVLIEKLLFKGPHGTKALLQHSQLLLMDIFFETPFITLTCLIHLILNQP